MLGQIACDPKCEKNEPGTHSHEAPGNSDARRKERGVWPNRWRTGPLL